MSVHYEWTYVRYRTRRVPRQQMDFFTFLPSFETHVRAVRCAVRAVRVPLTSLRTCTLACSPRCPARARSRRRRRHAVLRRRLSVRAAVVRGRVLLRHCLQHLSRFRVHVFQHRHLRVRLCTRAARAQGGTSHEGGTSHAARRAVRACARRRRARVRAQRARRARARHRAHAPRALSVPPGVLLWLCCGCAKCCRVLVHPRWRVRSCVFRRSARARAHPWRTGGAASTRSRWGRARPSPRRRRRPTWKNRV